MSKWYKMPPSYRITDGEYKANVDGINIVFGAVLGFVLVGGEGLPVRDFVALLMLSAAVVVMILYLSQSEYKLFYIVLTAATIVAFPYIAEDFFKLARVPKLQPTLAVWALMVLLVELIPREKDAEGDT
ncbi:hypothetical protein [Erythrobacter sp. F6033]|uniref:hypothetical protein n=1 Tax=Erythrobacter sp. F6033 TaxID=2926401 RepID=UPI001FF6666E|nr:hypothetical protein [Erythrobacter sp. F6033]MCK0128958.1 hypothetical protein [Erythrobacter sp. F6033]